MTTESGQNAQERRARMYCQTIGADPDEIVVGFHRNEWRQLVKECLPRWRFYVGAYPGLSVQA